MATVVGIWIALAGTVPALAGLTGVRRARRLRRDGVRAWSTAVPFYPAGEDGQVALRYTLPDGRVVENAAVRRTGTLLAGERVLIWYDPADPADAVIQGREGRTTDLVFAVIGAVLVVAGTVIAIVAP